MSDFNIKKDSLTFTHIETDNYLPEILDLPIGYINSKDFPIHPETKDIPSQRKDIPSFIDVDETTNTHEFTIRYDKIFPDNDIFKDEDNRLEKIFKQRIDIPAYVRTVPMVVGDLNFILNVYPEFSLIYAAIKQNIYFTDKYKNDIQAFATDIVNLVLDFRFRDIIHTMNETTYEIDLDSHIKSREGDNTIVTDFQVTDELNKIIIESGMAYRVISPLLNEYLATLNYDMSYKSDIITDIHMEIIRRFSIPRNIDIDNKLYKIVNPRIRNTTYSNRVIWKYLKNMGRDPRTVTYEIYRQLINAIINKMRNNYSSISLLDVVIRKKTKFIFQANFPIKYKPLPVSKDTGEDEDDVDYIEREFQRPGNEIDMITNKLSIREYIQEHKNLIDTEEIDKLLKFIHTPNEIQEDLIRVYYAEKFDISSIDRRTKMILIYLMYRETDMDMEYKYISDLLVAKRVDDPEKDEKRFTNMYSPTRHIHESLAYQNLMAEYTWTSSIIARKNMFVTYSGIARYTFETFNHKRLDDIEKNDIIEEMTRFFKTV